jgi:hypothetical protein
MAHEGWLPAARTSRRQPGIEENRARISEADDSRRLDRLQVVQRRSAHTTLRLSVAYGAGECFADAPATVAALHLFRASIGLPAPALNDHGAAITAIWRLAAALRAPAHEHAAWQLRWLWGAFKPKRTDACGHPIYDLPPDLVLEVKRGPAAHVVLAAGAGPQPPWRIESLLATAEDAMLEAAYRRALVRERGPLSW